MIMIVPNVYLSLSFFLSVYVHIKIAIPTTSIKFDIRYKRVLFRAHVVRLVTDPDWTITGFIYFFFSNFLDDDDKNGNA